jgi:hypothetical protein
MAVQSAEQPEQLDLTSRQVFLDPNKGRCNFCHLNAGAKFQHIGKGRNFDTEIRTAPAVGGIGVRVRQPDVLSAITPTRKGTGFAGYGAQ